MATSSIVVPAQGTVDQEVITLATQAKADVEGISAASLAATTPAALGVAATAGAAATASKSDHIHAWAQKLTVAIDDTITGSADTNGTPNTPINVGAALPARAIVLAIEVVVATPASGGSVVTALLDVGWAGSTETLLKDFDLVAASAGSYDQNAGGAASTKTYPVQAGGKQLALIVTPDGAHKLSALTALGATINVYYVVPF